MKASQLALQPKHIHQLHPTRSCLGMGRFGELRTCDNPCLVSAVVIAGPECLLDRTDTYRFLPTLSLDNHRFPTASKQQIAAIISISGRKRNRPTVAFENLAQCPLKLDAGHLVDFIERGQLAPPTPDPAREHPQKREHQRHRCHGDQRPEVPKQVNPHVSKIGTPRHHVSRHSNEYEIPSSTKCDSPTRQSG